MSYVRVVNDTEAVPPSPAEPALKTGYEPDRFQKFAIAAIEAGENVLVTAKTGSGKTFVGEYQIAASLRRGGRVFYTTPIKSLSNQKFHDLKNLFPEASVGIMTGDIKFRPDAQIIVMTTEILRNLLFKQGSATERVGATALVSLEGLDAVVFDEVHYINDPDRGHVWEETLILLPPAVKLILLSATLSSPIGFASWLGNLKKVRIWLISTLWRAVPLEHCVIGCDGRLSVIYDSKERFDDMTYKAWLMGRNATLLAHDKFKEKVKGARLAGHEGAVGGKVRPKAFEHQMNECLEMLRNGGNLPAIFFVFSRAGCERLAEKVAGEFLDSSDSALVAHIWDFHLSRFRASLEKSPQAWKLRELAMRGIAYHHSGLLPFMKEILEILFSKGLVKVLFATETFAVGINMPTKTVVFTALDKFSEGGVRPLRSSEYIQMAGRAGRRGKDDRGLVLYLPQRDPADLPVVRQILTGKAATFGSRMTFHYDFVLKTLNQEGGRGMTTLIEDSYWRALLSEEYASADKEKSAADADAASLLAGLTAEQVSACEERDEIERKIGSLQNAKKKAALRELETWETDHKNWSPHLARHKKYKDALSAAAAHARVCANILGEAEVSIVSLRRSVLEEYGFVNSGAAGAARAGAALTDLGRLASEINEGHPFLMTELFLRIRRDPPSLPDLLTILSVFLGEGRDDEVSLRASQLEVNSVVRAQLQQIEQDARTGRAREERAGIRDDPKFWDIHPEWVEPIAHWVGTDDILPVVAAQIQVFEGNLQRALMKLMGLVDEITAMATLDGAVALLSVLEGAQRIVLRDVVLAESLYLRL